MQIRTLFLSMAAASVLAAAPVAHAKTFKWASQGEISTWDIHSQNNALQNGLHSYVYETLVTYNSRTFAVEPLLATAWREVSPPGSTPLAAFERLLEQLHAVPTSEQPLEVEPQGAAGYVFDGC